MSWEANNFDALTNSEPEKIGISTIIYIESLLNNSLLREEEKRYDLEILTEQEAIQLIEYLQKNQVDIIDSGRNYGQKDILRKLKQFE